MTSAHIFFIPGVLIIGMFVGFLFGTRAAADRANLELRREDERKKAREARALRKKQRQENLSKQD